LLWTKDRRTVKISDFGVSHFSYAQRLAAATKQEIDQDGDNDKVLMDDSDLSQTAGTPFFLAPEVVAEPVPVSSTSASSSSLRVDVLRKPPITKAIDVWALGVTLYGLLFGHLPWQAEEENALRHRLEYLLHGMIRDQDWQPDEFMAWDRIPTGGRRPHNNGSDGYVVMNVLDAMLQKDAQKRITIPELKVCNDLNSFTKLIFIDCSLNIKLGMLLTTS
jgi:SNF1-activating kinase 1